MRFKGLDHTATGYPRNLPARVGVTVVVRQGRSRDVHHEDSVASPTFACRDLVTRIPGSWQVAGRRCQGPLRARPSGSCPFYSMGATLGAAAPRSTPGDIEPVPQRVEAASWQVAVAPPLLVVSGLEKGYE